MTPQEQDAADRAAAERAGWRFIIEDDLSTRPIIEGRYAVMVSGDEERDGPHVFYSYADYQTTATGYLDEFDQGDDADPVDVIRFKGDHDEEDEMIFAWFGPLVDGQRVPPFYGN